MPVMYNGKKIIPVTNVTISRENQRTEAGQFKKAFFKIIVEGTLVAYKGSPDATGTFWTGAGNPPDTSSGSVTTDNRLALIRNKQAALLNLFDTEGFFFEIQPYDGSASTKFIPRANTISFEKGNWFDQCRFTIELETDVMFFGSVEVAANDDTNDYEETWSIEPSDDKSRTYKMSHSLSAQAKNTFDDGGTGVFEDYGWEVAKARVTPLLGFSASIRDDSNVGVDSTYTPYNYVIQENIDVKGGKYSVTETWLLYDAAAYIEEYTISTRTNTIEGFSTVSIDGNIQGFSSTGTPGLGNRWTNAQNGFAIVEPLIASRALSLSAIADLITTPINTVVGKNEINGTITYNYEFHNLAGPSTTGALRETISVQNSEPVELVAKHQCVMREIGPVLQPIFSRTEKRRSLSITVKMPPAKGNPAVYSTEPDVSAIITSYIPVATYEGPYIDRNETNWSKTSGEYSRTVSWFWV